MCWHFHLDGHLICCTLSGAIGVPLVVCEETGKVFALPCPPRDRNTVNDLHQEKIPVKFEVCCQNPVFRPALIRDKIINCGWVRGTLIIKNKRTGGLVCPGRYLLAGLYPSPPGH